MKASDVYRQLERADQLPAVRSDVKKSKALEWLVEHVEIVDDGVNGFLVNSPAEAAEAIERAAELDRAEIRRLATQRFGVERMAEEYLALYRRILGHGRPSHWESR